MFRFFVFLFFSLISAVYLMASGDSDETFSLLKVNASMFYDRCPEILREEQLSYSHENYELRDTDEENISYEKFAKNQQALTEKRERQLNESFVCDIYGTYLFYKGLTKIGMVSLSNGKGEYYENRANLYGFTTGEYVCRGIFLDEGHKGKGYFGRLHNKVMELINPFIGRKHLVRNDVGEFVESDLPFQGTRGLTDLSNVPSIRASLKAGATLVSIPEDRDHWIVQFPSKVGALSEQERELKRVAALIIEESLKSFLDAPFEYGDIPSTLEAQGAVTRYYYQNTLLFPDRELEEKM